MAFNRQQDKLNELTERLQEGVKNVFESENYAEYLRVMSRFHNYSYRNTLLIAMQNPDATMVASYTAWKNKFGRQVNRGEKAIQILSPAPYRKKEELEVIDNETQLPVRNPDGSIMMEEVEVTIPAFRVASVFDVSQTTGEPLPSLFNNIEGDVGQFANFMDAMRTVSPVPIEFQAMKDKDGYYSLKEKKIYLRDDMSEVQTVAAVIHEVAHAKLHDLDLDNLKESLKARGKDQKTMEVEAESIAYVVSQRYGIDTGENSFGYVAMWSGGKELPELQASLEIIRDTSAELIDGIDQRLEELEREQIDLPDSSIGIEDMQAYGYLEEDMYPLRKDAALNFHRMGEKIYCLNPDNTHGEYASKEMIEEHTGIFGIKRADWDRMLEMEDMYGDSEMEDLYPQMASVDRETALNYYDEGETIYRITTNPMPIAVQDRMEIERGSDYFQMDKDEFDRVQFLEMQMQTYPQISSLKEAKLLLDSESRYGIYQIDPDSKGREYSFMGMDFIERHGMKPEIRDYRMVYSDRWYPADSLDGLFERFNMDRPQDFTGHSLSVSDVIVVNDGDNRKAFFVDSFGFQELPDFLKLEQTAQREQAYKVLDNKKGYAYFEIHECEEGYDYTFYGNDFKGIDGGVYDNPEISMNEAIRDVISDEKVRLGELLSDYESFIEQVEDAERIVPETKSLETAEELEEANYNMIDDQINNEPKKKEDRTYVEYYVAECEEYHSMGKYYSGLTLEEAAEKYKEILDDPRLSYFGNSLGVIYHDPDDEFYSGSECPLICAETICGDALDEIPYMKNSPAVREALEEVRLLFPGFAYRPPHEIEEEYYPKDMNAQRIAKELDALVYDFDPYEYKNQVNDRDDFIEEITLTILMDEISDFYEQLEEIIEEGDGDLPAKASQLLEQMKTFRVGTVENIEPVVKIILSEYADLSDRKYVSLKELDSKVRNLDHKFSNIRDVQSGDPERTYRLQFTVYYAENGKMEKLSGKMNIGDGDGGLVSSMKAQIEMQQKDESWMAYRKSMNKETYEAYQQEMTDMQEHILPYLQTYCSVQERQPAKTPATKKKENAVSAKQAVSPQQPKVQSKAKLSIHERLQRNKEMISAQKGSSQERKGIELS